MSERGIAAGRTRMPHAWGVFVGVGPVAALVDGVECVDRFARVVAHSDVHRTPKEV